MRQKMIPAIKVHTHVASTVSEFTARRENAGKPPAKPQATSFRVAIGAPPCITMSEAFSGAFARRAA
jgi:hypothetical protein